MIKWWQQVRLFVSSAISNMLVVTFRCFEMGYAGLKQVNLSDDQVVAAGEAAAGWGVMYCQQCC
jgi:hypothetical protein